MLHREVDLKEDQWKMCGIGALIILGLFARDMMGISVNKFLFLLIALISIFFLETKNVAVFTCFLVPLYVGLPGNFISVFLLARLFYDAVKYKFHIEKTGFVLTLCVVAYITVQDFLTGYTGIYHLMAAFDFILLAFSMSVIRQYRVGTQAVVAYAIGNFALGAVMLSATLSYYSLQDLMNPATRLGYTGMLIGNTGANMATSIDPNFYAMNTIACISTVSLLLPKFQSKMGKIAAVISMIGSTVCCLIGLSRTFIILLAVWAVLWFLSQGDIKKTVAVLAVMSLFVFAFLKFMPTIAQGFLNRFEGADVVGGNGRINLILLYFKPWFETVLSILFGIGLFNCHTHCAPLMYLFGLGIVGTIPLFSWFAYQWNRCAKCCRKVGFQKIVPLFLTLIGYSSIPAAGAINYTLPIMISMIALVSENRMGESNE